MPIRIVNPGEEAPLKPEVEPEVVIPVEPEPIDAIREAEIIDDALDGIEEEDPIIEE